MNKLAFCAVAFAIAAPMAVHAQSVDGSTNTAKASYAGLDLTQTHDARIMLDRLNDAALEACGASRASFSEYQAAIRQSECYQTGVGQAVDQLNAPKVAELYRRGATVSVSSDQ